MKHTCGTTAAEEKAKVEKEGKVILMLQKLWVHEIQQVSDHNGREEGGGLVKSLTGINGSQKNINVGDGPCKFLYTELNKCPFLGLRSFFQLFV